MYLFKRSLSCGVENGLVGVREAAGGQEMMSQIRVGAVGGGARTDAGCRRNDAVMV